jgi:hypothetical protein
MSQYQDTIDKARFGEQVSMAMRQGSAVTPRQPPPSDKRYMELIRVHVVRAVFAIWNVQGHQADLLSIYNRVHDSLPWDPDFDKTWTAPSKRTVDRRVNEAADPRFADPTPIIAVKPGLYIPNPLNFDGRARVLLDALVA